MAERRWGRVTVEGWIQEAPGEWRVVTAKTGSAGIVAVAYKIPVGASVVFLPEPVQFKDGDVVQYRRDSQVFLRLGGLWHGSGCDDAVSERVIAADLRDGYVVRLVPEANGD